jgi:hypothetical protein
LSVDQKEKFHTATAQLLYLSKRIRPDLQLAVSFLTTRVQNPTKQDEDKLMRVLRYLNSTKDLPMKFQIDKESIRLDLFVDASYGTHHDFKSHTGSVVRLGNSTVGCKSTKQKLNSKSSCEAELIGVSDMVGEVLRIAHLLEELGFKTPPPRLLQDNMSTIALLERGRPASSATKHISIKFFFTSDLLKRKELTIEYCPTELMLGDILTKPIQGKQFTYLRDVLLGLMSRTEGSVADCENCGAATSANSAARTEASANSAARARVVRRE